MFVFTAQIFAKLTRFSVVTTNLLFSVIIRAITDRSKTIHEFRIIHSTSGERGREEGKEGGKERERDKKRGKVRCS